MQRGGADLAGYLGDALQVDIPAKAVHLFQHIRAHLHRRYAAGDISLERQHAHRIIPLYYKVLYCFLIKLQSYLEVKEGSNDG